MRSSGAASKCNTRPAIATLTAIALVGSGVIALVAATDASAAPAAKSASTSTAKAAKAKAAKAKAEKAKKKAKRHAKKHAKKKRPPQAPPRTPAPPPAPNPPTRPAPDSATWYSTDGSGNNLSHSSWGSAGINLRRQSSATYGDGVSTPTGADRPSGRAVSNSLSAQSDDILNRRNLSGMIYVFGQFLDHDLSQTKTTGGASFPIQVPMGDPEFDPTSTGTKTIGLKRSVFDPATGTSSDNPRQQVNSVTAFIDGSQVYGSDATRAAALRTFSGGKLRTSTGNMLPFNTDGFPNDNDAHVVSDANLFLAGDTRANENPALVAMQTLFMREHNRVATSLASRNPTWTDEQLYQEARRAVCAELQAIVFNEFLPALLGQGAVAHYTGYQADANPGIDTEFSTGAFRFGHSTLDSDVGRMDDDGTDTPQGPMQLRDGFFNTTVYDPSLPNHEGDIDPFLKAVASETAQEVDTKLIDEIRNFLFGRPGQGGFDLAALNIQRGRDHGLADYNSIRAAYGLPRVTSFAGITPNVASQNKLRDLYGTVDNIDLWTGGLAEAHAPGSSVGPLFQRIMGRQFSALRNGDRHYFENQSPVAGIRDVGSTRLSDVIKRNTSLTHVQPNVFLWRD